MYIHLHPKLIKQYIKRLCKKKGISENGQEDVYHLYFLF